MGFYPNTANQSVAGNFTVSGSSSLSTLSVTSTSLMGGIVTENAGTNTSGSAPRLTPANSNGTAAQLSDTTRDYMLILTVGTAGTAFGVSIGPTSGVADTLFSGAAATSGEVVTFRLPAGWFWEWSATTATLASQVAIGC